MKSLIIALAVCVTAAVAAHAVPNNNNCSAQCDALGCDGPSGQHGSCVSSCEHDALVCNPSAPQSNTCSAAPTVVISVNPSMIWPPNHKMVSVALAGTISEPAGCTTISKSCQLVDEYGLFSGPVSISGGDSFSGTSYVEAWRLGQDMDGRTYTYTCSATNQFGTGTSNAAVSTVPHDQRP